MKVGGGARLTGGGATPNTSANGTDNQVAQSLSYLPLSGEGQPGCGSPAGVNLVAGPLQSGDRFDRAWALLAATYQAEIVTLHNVVPFPSGGQRNVR